MSVPKIKTGTISIVLATLHYILQIAQTLIIKVRPAAWYTSLYIWSYVFAQRKTTFL